MVRKRIRRNHYKNRAAKMRDKIIRHIIFCLKAVAVVAVLHLISFLFILCHDFLIQCDYFRTESLIVTGADRLSEEQVIKQAELNKGINILSVNLSITRKKLLTHPWIAEAEVSRELPARINIKIKEQKPYAILDLGRKFVINADGEIFKEMDASDPVNLPIISGLEFADINVHGKTRSAPYNAVMNILELGQKPESVIPIKLINRIHVDRELGLTVYAFDHIKAIKIGYDDYKDKFAKLKNVLLYLKKRDGFSNLESIDLNNLNRIVINPTRFDSPAEEHKEV